MQDEFPRILVLMATYNGQEYIMTQINSILAQKNVEITLQIADDRSTDDTLNIVKNIINENNNISFVKNELNTGSAALNFFQMINSISNLEQYDYVSFADQDDEWLPNKLHEGIKLLQKTDSSLYSSELMLWNGIEVYSKTKKHSSQKRFDHIFESASAGCTYILDKNLVAKVQETIKIMDFRSWKGLSHDWLIYYLARSNGLNVIVDSNSYINYRIHANNNFGVMSIFKPSSIMFRLKLLNNSWYKVHLTNMLSITNINKMEYKIISAALSKNLFKRMVLVAKHGLQLRRELYKCIILNIYIISNKL